MRGSAASLRALGDADDPGSLRARTVVVRCADHGEMGLSHGGLRQKAFNAYEETINVPLVVSNPVLFPAPAETDALASLVDLLPTMLTLAGVPTPARPARPRPDTAAGRRRDAGARGSGPLPDPAGPGRRPPRPHRLGPGRDPLHLRRPSGRDRRPRGPGQPNRVRAIRTPTHMYARLPRPGWGCGHRARALRPRARPRSAPQPARRPLGRAPARLRRAASRRARRAPRAGDARGRNRARLRAAQPQTGQWPAPSRRLSATATTAWVRYE